MNTVTACQSAPADPTFGWLFPKTGRPAGRMIPTTAAPIRSVYARKVCRARIFAAGVALLAPLPCLSPARAAALSCTQAAALAEADGLLPRGMLLAIGNIESGRTDKTGRRAPWPWTVNAGGSGRFFDTADAATAAVQELRASGVRSIDIGCFQINLLHHPAAFADLASGFDPLINATAAAQFLLSLHKELGAWELAIAAYHSRATTLGGPYRNRVLASWSGAPPVDQAPFLGVHVWGVHIWGPAGEIGVRTSPTPLEHAWLFRSRLPRVISVSGR